jgi:Predicted membrane protein (DUF2232)
MPASRALPLAALGGLVAALLYAALLTGSFGGYMLFWMAPLPLFMVGLRLGLKPVALAALVGTAGVAAASPDLGLMFAATVGLPVLLLSGLAISQKPEQVAGRLALALGGIGLIAFAIAYALAADQEGGLLGATTRTVQDAVDWAKNTVDQMMPGSIQPSDLSGDEVAKAAVRLPGLFAATWVALILGGNGILAMGALARFGGALVPVPSMASIAMPRVASLALGAALVAAYGGQGEVAFIGTSLAAILSVPLLFLGLGVIHAFLARHPARAVLLTVFYAVLFGPAISLIVALGVIEQWVGLRRRLIPAPAREKNDG